MIGSLLALWLLQHLLLNRHLSFDFYEHITQTCCAYRRGNEDVPVQPQPPQPVPAQQLYRTVQVGPQAQALYKTVPQPVSQQYIVQAQPPYTVAANHPSIASISAINSQASGYGLAQAIQRGHIPAETTFPPALSTDAHNLSQFLRTPKKQD